MNIENYEYLKDQVKMTGFGEALESALKEKMTAGDTEFQLNHKISYGEKQMDFTLNFSKSKTHDNYFFNCYDATLTKPGEVVNNRFYTDDRITAKESFNLLEGRSVEKKYNHHEKVVDGDSTSYKPIKDSTYNVWVKLDFNDADSKGNFKMKTYGERWGFDLGKLLSELPIKQLQNAEDREDLINSLKKGNLQSVTFDIDGEKVSRLISANPRTRAIGIFDKDGSPVQEMAQAPVAKVDVEKKPELAEKKGNAEKQENTAKKKTSKKQSVR